MTASELTDNLVSSFSHVEIVCRPGQREPPLTELRSCSC